MIAAKAKKKSPAILIVLQKNLERTIVVMIAQTVIRVL